MNRRRLWDPLTSASTYRRWAYLIVGGALLVPYLLFGIVIVPSVLPVTTVPAALAVGSPIALAVLVATAFIPAVRTLEATAARELLDVPAKPGESSPARAALLFSVHVLLGGLLGAASLLVPAAAIWTFGAPFTGTYSFGMTDPIPVPRGWTSAWLPVAGLAAVVLLGYVVAGLGRVLERIATALLRPSPATRMAELEEAARRLAERNRLARELHDSVGHTLSVVALQAGAASGALRRDPDAAERALGAIGDSARAALADLDHVLGLLREEPRDRTPQADLGSLPELLAATRAAGVDVTATVEGDLDALPAAMSRETYRIVQECLTNAAKHAGTSPVAVVLRARDGEVELTVRNPLRHRDRPSRSRGGRGVRGMAERVALLRGEFEAGAEDGQWVVAVRLPPAGGELA